MRIRLLYAIGLLDMQAALDRATHTMISPSWMSECGFPKNLNDLDLVSDLQGEGELASFEGGFTDLSFAVLTSHAQYVGRLLNFPVSAGMVASDWSARQQHVDDFRQVALSLIKDNGQADASSPFYWFVKQMAEILPATTLLFAIRPLRKASCAPPNGTPVDLLRLSVQVIEKTQQLVQDPRSIPWRWFEGIFPPWHSLAVAIAEICVCEDSGLIARSWPTIEATFSRLKYLVADNQASIWGPMERLMEQAKENVRRKTGESGIFPRAAFPAAEPAAASVSERVDVETDETTETATFATVGLNASLEADVISNWPDISQSIEFMMAGETNATGVPGSISWVNWEDFITDLNAGGDSLFPFR
jgi:hypothetical protein